MLQRELAPGLLWCKALFELGPQPHAAWPISHPVRLAICQVADLATAPGLRISPCAEAAEPPYPPLRINIFSFCNESWSNAIAICLPLLSCSLLMPGKDLGVSLMGLTKLTWHHLATFRYLARMTANVSETKFCQQRSAVHILDIACQSRHHPRR